MSASDPLQVLVTAIPLPLITNTIIGSFFGNFNASLSILMLLREMIE